MFHKKGALKNIAKLSGKFLCQRPFVNKIGAYKETLAQVFSCKYCKIFEKIFFYSTLLMAASGKMSQ